MKYTREIGSVLLVGETQDGDMIRAVILAEGLRIVAGDQWGVIYAPILTREQFQNVIDWACG